MLGNLLPCWKPARANDIQWIIFVYYSWLINIAHDRATADSVDETPSDWWFAGYPLDWRFRFAPFRLESPICWVPDWRIRFVGHQPDSTADSTNVLCLLCILMMMINDDGLIKLWSIRLNLISNNKLVRFRCSLSLLLASIESLLWLISLENTVNSSPW